MAKDIILTTINAKWIHPSLALRLLKANLGALESRCEIIEFALRQPLAEKIESLLAVLALSPGRPQILGISVSIWNHLAALELLAELEKAWAAISDAAVRPIVVLGGPEVSYLPPEAKIFRHADYVIRGDGETAFRELCEKILTDGSQSVHGAKAPEFTEAGNAGVTRIKSAYHLYTDEDISKKLIYVEASRGCPFNCEFCLSAATSVATSAATSAADGQGRVCEFPLEPFLAEMDDLVRRGAGTFKFLDRTFNLNIKRAVTVMEFFLKKIEERGFEADSKPIVVHFEMVPSLFPRELCETLTRFPPGTLRLEIGIQTLNAEVSARIARPSNPEKDLEAVRFLREKTHAIIHADLIAGLPGEDLASFGEGFDRLWFALGGDSPGKEVHAEIQPGILKLLPGAPIARHNETSGMRYNSLPPYEVLETSAMTAAELHRVKNFARFWEIIVNRKLVSFECKKPVFKNFMALSDSLLAHFGKNWGIDKYDLLKTIHKFI